MFFFYSSRSRPPVFSLCIFFLHCYTHSSAGKAVLALNKGLQRSVSISCKPFTFVEFQLFLVIFIWFILVSNLFRSTVSFCALYFRMSKILTTTNLNVFSNIFDFLIEKRSYFVSRESICCFFEPILVLSQF